MPIYDARRVKSVDITEVLSRLDELPMMCDDVPHGTCAVVAYTVNTYAKKADPLRCVSFNIKWLMVMGVPGDNRVVKKKRDL